MLLFKLLFKNLHTFLTNSRQREFYRLLLFYGSVNRYQKKKISFLRYNFIVPDCASFLWQFKEIFADEIYKFNSPTKQPIILDCGANVGTSCLYFKTLFPEAKITAFEADPSMAVVLKENMLLNGIKDIEVVPKAVWVHQDGVQMQLDGSDGGSIHIEGSNQVLVPSIRLKTILENAEFIDFLKIDIEGAEIAVMEDCKDVLHKASHIFLEYHSYLSASQSLGTILENLTSNGFRYYCLPVNIRNKPFVNKGTNNVMDFQANIFAYKIL